MDNTQTPTVHVNGTSARALKEQLHDAYKAVTAARDALRAAAPHGRDYYVQPDPQAYQWAREAHIERLRKLETVADELMVLFYAVSAQDRS